MTEKTTETKREWTLESFEEGVSKLRGALESSAGVRRAARMLGAKLPVEPAKTVRQIERLVMDLEDWCADALREGRA